MTELVGFLRCSAFLQSDEFERSKNGSYIETLPAFSHYPRAVNLDNGTKDNMESAIDCMTMYHSPNRSLFANDYNDSYAQQLDYAGLPRTFIEAPRVCKSPTSPLWTRPFRTGGLHNQRKKKHFRWRYSIGNWQTMWLPLVLWHIHINFMYPGGPLEWFLQSIVNTLSVDPSWYGWKSAGKHQVRCVLTALSILSTAAPAHAWTQQLKKLSRSKAERKQYGKGGGRSLCRQAINIRWWSTSSSTSKEVILFRKWRSGPEQPLTMEIFVRKNGLGLLELMKRSHFTSPLLFQAAPSFRVHNSPLLFLSSWRCTCRWEVLMEDCNTQRHSGGCLLKSNAEESIKESRLCAFHFFSADHRIL